MNHEPTRINEIQDSLILEKLCQPDHKPRFKIKYDLGRGDTSTEFVCENCIQQTPYQVGIVSLYCFLCGSSHSLFSSNCPIFKKEYGS